MTSKGFKKTTPQEKPKNHDAELKEIKEKINDLESRIHNLEVNHLTVEEEIRNHSHE